MNEKLRSGSPAFHSRHVPWRIGAPVFALMILGAVLFSAGCSRSEAESVAPPPAAMLTIEDIRGARGESVTFPVVASKISGETRAIEWVVDLGIKEIAKASIRAGADAPANARVFIEPAPGEGAPAFLCRVAADDAGESGGAGASIGSGEIARITIKMPGRIVGRMPFHIRDARALAADPAAPPAALLASAGTIAVSLLSAPVTLFAFMAGCVALIFWLGQRKALAGFFRYLPPLIWTYFIPMLATTLGITPDQSPLYSPFMSRIILPAILVLLLIPSDLSGIAKLGFKALFMMLTGTLGIVLGALGSFALFTKLFPSAIPPETWKGIAALSGSWIGGSPNMFAVMESVGTPPSIIGPLVVVDTVLAYSWLGLLIALSAYQKRVDAYHKADSSVIDKISAHLEAEHAANARDPKVADIALMIGVAFVVSQICIWLGKPIFKFFDATLGFRALSEVINAYGWGILLITAAGLALSMTRLRALDYCGASSIGYVGLYLLLTCYGAQANLKAVIEVPVFFGIGFVWIVIHVAILYAGMRLLRAPLFLASTSSMANIGGTASAPVVAAAYNQSMAPVGLVMAIIGSILGTPVALFVVAVACKAISGE